jgi:hypothetical protein
MCLNMADAKPIVSALSASIGDVDMARNACRALWGLVEHGLFL